MFWGTIFHEYFVIVLSNHLNMEICFIYGHRGLTVWHILPIVSLFLYDSAFQFFVS